MAKLVLVCISILTVAVQSFATRPLGEAYKDSASGDSLNTVENLCALVPNSTTGSVAKLCHDLAGVAVGLDESIYCGHEVFNETEEMSAPPEPSFTMREIVGSNTSEQAYNAVVDRCTNQSASSARRQMAVGNPWWGNYGWCSTDTGFLLSKVGIGYATDTANYCDATTSEANWGRGTDVSNCCAEHDKCLNCDPTDWCTGSSNDGYSCDRKLGSCALKATCLDFYVVVMASSIWGNYEWTPPWWTRMRVFIRVDFECLFVAGAIAVVMSGLTPNYYHTCDIDSY